MWQLLIKILLVLIPAFFKKKSGVQQSNIIDAKIDKESDAELDADASKWMRK